MKRYRKFSLLSWIVYLLLFIGLFNALLISPSRIIIPAIIFGLIVYFYKHPEKLRFMGTSKRTTHHYKRKNVSFKVIHGKKDYKDDEPKYH